MDLVGVEPTPLGLKTRLAPTRPGPLVNCCAIAQRRLRCSRRGGRYAQLMRGDRVEIVIATDDGTKTYHVVATRAGRRVETTWGRGIVEVVEVTRSGEPVRTARFMASRVVALVEHPAGETPRTSASPVNSQQRELHY